MGLSLAADEKKIVVTSGMYKNNEYILAAKMKINLYLETNDLVDVLLGNVNVPHEEYEQLAQELTNAVEGYKKDIKKEKIDPMFYFLHGKNDFRAVIAQKDLKEIQ